MHATTDRLEFSPPPTPGAGRAVGLAILAHAFLLAALTWGVHWKSDAVYLSAEAELWSSVPQQAAPKPVETAPTPPVPKPPQPQPEPSPPPPKPVPKIEPLPPKVDIALEQKKRRLQKEKALEQDRLEKLKLEKLKLEKLNLEKRRLEEQHERERKAALEKKKAADEAKRKDLEKAKELQELKESQQREAQRKANIQRMTGLAGATGSPGATGTALQSSGPSAGYAGRIRGRIKPNIVFTDGIASNPMAEVEVRTSPDGTIISRKLIKSSGVASWDDAVLRAIDKTEVLPRDTDGRVPPTLVISFRPKD